MPLRCVLEASNLCTYIHINKYTCNAFLQTCMCVNTYACRYLGIQSTHALITHTGMLIPCIVTCIIRTGNWANKDSRFAALPTELCRHSTSTLLMLETRSNNAEVRLRRPYMSCRRKACTLFKAGKSMQGPDIRTRTTDMYTEILKRHPHIQIRK